MEISERIVEAAARAAHEANRSYCLALGDDSQPHWEDAPAWQRKSALIGARAALTEPKTSPERSHESWLAHKQAEGWKYGPVKDVEKREHPCMLPYGDLPEAQRAKDHLFLSVVRSVGSALGVKRRVVR